MGGDAVRTARVDSAQGCRPAGEDQQEIIYWIMRETGGTVPKAGFKIHKVANILHRAAAMVTEPRSPPIAKSGATHINVGLNVGRNFFALAERWELELERSIQTRP
jgi:hypothetical protein